MTRRTLVLRTAGTNCDGETVAALELAGAEVERWHVNRLLKDPASLERFQLLVLPGGFTYGDDVAGAAVFAYTLERRLLAELRAFVEDGRRVLGICNGFQVLVRLGFLPGTGGRGALLPNHSGRFEARWVRLRAGSAPGPWLEPHAEYSMPVAHAEGRFEWFPDTEGDPFPEASAALTYVGAREPAEYPANPNGSFQGIAGVVNPQGNVFGLMPHPERFVRVAHHPYWSRFRPRDSHLPTEADLPTPLGLEIFRRAVRDD